MAATSPARATINGRLETTALGTADGLAHEAARELAVGGH
jgi:hypothetical protein